MREGQAVECELEWEQNVRTILCIMQVVREQWSLSVNTLLVNDHVVLCVPNQSGAFGHLCIISSCNGGEYNLYYCLLELIGVVLRLGGCGYSYIKCYA